MRSRIFIVALSVCLSSTTMLLGASKGPGAPRTVTSTTYATFTVRSAVNLSDESRPATNGNQLEGLASPSGDGANREPAVKNSVDSEYLLQSGMSPSVEKTDTRGVSVQRVPERKKVIVFLNN